MGHVIPFRAPSTLTSRLRHAIAPSTRARGAMVLAAGRVGALEGDEREVSAQIDMSYRVVLRVEAPARVAASCTCPAFAGDPIPCKHVWAVVLAAEQSGKLAGASAERCALGSLGAAPPAEPATDDAALEMALRQSVARLSDPAVR